MEHADYYLPENLMAKLSPEDKLVEQKAVTAEKPIYISRTHLITKYLSVRRLLTLAEITDCQIHEAATQVMYIISTTWVPKEEDESDPAAQRVMATLYRRLDDIEVLAQDAINMRVAFLVGGLYANPEKLGESATEDNLLWAKMVLGIDDEE